MAIGAFGSIRKDKKRTFAIGDVHGCAAELEALLERLKPTSQDRFVFLGDYVDRGPASRRVIDIIINLSTISEVIALKGNHESMFLDFLERPESAGAGLFILNGGAATLASYASGENGFEIPESHIKFLQGLRLWFQTDTHFFVHAGVPLQPLSTLTPEEHEEQVMWSRQPFLSTNYKWEKIIVHGHTPTAEPERKENRINLDTGCVYGGQLTALELPSGRFHEVARGTKVAPTLFPIDSKKTPTEDGTRIALRFSGRLPVEAGKAGRPQRNFETMNFNQFGLLLKEMESRDRPSFEIGDEIEGTIGLGDNSILFVGLVVRTETRGEFMNYGVRIDKISNGSGGREWIARPGGKA